MNIQTQKTKSGYRVIATQGRFSSIFYNKNKQDALSAAIRSTWLMLHKMRQSF